MTRAVGVNIVKQALFYQLYPALNSIFDGYISCKIMWICSHGHDLALNYVLEVKNQFWWRVGHSCINVEIMCLIWFSNMTLARKVTYIWHDQVKWIGCQEYWFWVTGFTRWQILMFNIIFVLQRIVHIFATRCLIEMGFGSKCSILNEQLSYTKNWNWILLTCD